MSDKHAKPPVVLVTGASSGLGKAFAKALLEQGMTVYAAARREQQMADLVQLGAIAVSMDISSEASVSAAVAQISKAHGGVDILVNNAGFGLYGAMEDTALTDARYQFEVNLFGLARLTQLLLPAMRARGAGRIINISSMGGKVYMPLGAWYHASKHALEGWSDCLRVELAPLGIDVVIIEPGAIATEFGDVMVAPMLQRSGRGPYAPMAQAMAAATQKSYSKGGASPPSVIVRELLRAIHARRPKTRYVAGKYAKPMIFLRKWLGDRWFDRILASMLR